ncbi:MAG: anthranilate synthase component I family protein [Crocinitomicaceae bacterium]|nr:anthranilate synthase component I family protein [Crocinitomicaceae bacterium]
MKKYLQVNIKASWNNLICKIEPKICTLLLRDDDNYTLAWGVQSEFIAQNEFNFKAFNEFRDQYKTDYAFGYFAYELKDDIEDKLTSENHDLLSFPKSYFFIPEHVLIMSKGVLTYFGTWSQNEIEQWLKEPVITDIDLKNQTIRLSAITPKTEYLKKVRKIKSHIQNGDIYEMNYCMNFITNTQNFNSFGSFLKLRAKTNSPFSSYLNLPFASILSGSPERFLNKRGHLLRSQPIKGTRARSKDHVKDNAIAQELINDPKERSENIMIVDLVRNDLSKVAEKNSVVVTELCGLHSFEAVHQLVSTVQCKLKRETSDSDVLKALFPMGSMTGAPKFRAMEIAEHYENFKRGIYSGTIGFFQPNGNFDFNVVIRSILYSKTTGKLTAAVGGAITIKSDPEKEYQECLTKLDALQKALC